MIKHPGEYRIIGDLERRYENPVGGNRYLRRLHPHKPIPPGYMEVLIVNNQSVYKDNGRLDGKFMSLKRFWLRGF